MIEKRIFDGEVTEPSQEISSSPLYRQLLDEDMADLVEMFVGDLPDRIAAIEKAVKDGDIATVAGLAHQLRGSAGGYGFSSITDAADSVESSAKNGEAQRTVILKTETLVSLCRRARAGAPAS